MRYDYSIVRFVPDTFKAEFVNVGLIVGNAATGDWSVQRLQNGERASRFRNGAPLSAAWSYLDELMVLASDLADDDVVPAHGVFAPGWLDDEHVRMRNLVQLSAPQPVLANSAHEAMRKLWSEMVVDPDRQARATAGPTRASLLSAYLNADVDQHLIHENLHARIGRQDERVDFVVGNGHVAQVAHAWTFRGQNLDRTVRNIKAWSWTLRDVRDGDGGVLIDALGGQPYTIDSSVPIDVVHDDPDTDDGKRALDVAIEVLDGLQVTAYSARDVGVVAQSAREQLTAHDSARATDTAVVALSPEGGR